MTTFIDVYPQLPLTIDVGGDRYYLGNGKSVDLAFKSRNDFLKTFTKNAKSEKDRRLIEYLLRKYMYYNIANNMVDKKHEFSFDDEEDKKELIKILKKRIQQLQQSNEFNSSTLKNTRFQRTYLKLQELINEIEGVNVISKVVPESTEYENIQYLQNLPEEKLVQVILELSWYLLHPDKVPVETLESWTQMIKQLDQLRMRDLIKSIHDLENKEQITPLEKPLNYFERIHIGKLRNTKTVNNALEEATKMATGIQDDEYRESLKQRLQILLDILHAKKYLTNSLPKNKQGLDIINEPTKQSLSNKIINNPLQGGGLRILDKKLSLAMRPLFDYFKGIYEPIYGLIDTTYDKYMNKTNSKTNIIPGLLALLHICQQIHPSETGEGGQPTYGVYRIENIPSDILSYVNFLIGETINYVTSLPKDELKNDFNDQINSLPKLRLTSLLNPFANPSAYKNPSSMPYLQLFTVGGNMTLLSEDEFLDSSEPKLTEEAYRATKDFCNSDDLYIVCSKMDNIRENIPMKVHNINLKILMLRIPVFLLI